MNSNIDKIKSAQFRWKLLARALKKTTNKKLDYYNELSIRRFTTFNLIKPILLNNELTINNELSTWYNYSCFNNNYNVYIKTINKNIFTANELIGFNNTGNVCVWPSEECLAYYLLDNQRICKNKNIIELGGGMSCLAGIFVAKYCEPISVTLTDGNNKSVDNVQTIIDKNNMNDYVKCCVVKWTNSNYLYRNIININQTWTLNNINLSQCNDNHYDVILCADCLFFDDTRHDLVDTIYGLLADDGIALVIAPKRGLTFQLFADTAVNKGFLARIIINYNDNVWKRHLELLDNCHEYCPDLHYPVLLELTKQKYTSPG